MSWVSSGCRVYSILGWYVCRPRDGLAALVDAAHRALEERDTVREQLRARVEAMRRRIIGEAARVSGLLGDL